ncbi:Hemolysin C [Bremerella volcania]|uniref:Hemolysin C n=1 Tax=Bremerella volcania TaxID=2527984 RepID=A0A518CGA9_9BACT|nr:hemolysin family protein [Bremerella volcania]QDU78265.1 Hemolysin C [Bremerella volcania]
MGTFELLVIALMIAFNSVFAAYEIALASIGLGRLHALKDAKRGGAASALRMKDNMEASLAVVQLGITLVAAVAAATGGAGAAEKVEPMLIDSGFSETAAALLAITLVVAPLTMITILFGELVPKVFALKNKEWICLKLSPPMEWFSYAVWPAVWFFEKSVTGIVSLFGKRKGDEGDISEAAIQELRGAASLARISNLIGRREEGIIVSASRLSATPLSDIMLPAQYMGMLPADETMEHALRLAYQTMHTRYPVTQQAGSPQRIIGYVNLKDIVAEETHGHENQQVRTLVRPIISFAAKAAVSECLERLMRERQHIALVRENDRVIGMVTLEDIVEEIIGEIHDEFDRLPTYVRRSGDGWLAGGFASLHHLQHVTGLTLKPVSEKPVLNLNDWILEHLTDPPTSGVAINDDNTRVVVRKTKGALVREAFLYSLPAEDAPAEPGQGGN